MDTRPMLGGCWARAATGQATAAPPRSAMNSRRLVFIRPLLAAEEMPRDYQLSAHAAWVRCIATGRYWLWPLWANEPSPRLPLPDCARSTPAADQVRGFLANGAVCQKRREQLQCVVNRSILEYLFDYLVSAGEDRGRNGDAEFFGDLQVHKVLEFRRLFRR